MRSVSSNSRQMSQTLLLALRRGILDQIAGPRPLLVEPFFRRVTDLLGGDGTDPIRPAAYVIDVQSDGDRGAIPARQRGLAVLGVDRLGDELGLDALQIRGGNGVMPDIGDPPGDHLLR